MKAILQIQTTIDLNMTIKQNQTYLHKTILIPNVMIIIVINIVAAINKTFDTFSIFSPKKTKLNGAFSKTRTCGLSLRRGALYPPEL